MKIEMLSVQMIPSKTLLSQQPLKLAKPTFSNSKIHEKERSLFSDYTQLERQLEKKIGEGERAEAAEVKKNERWKKDAKLAHATGHTV